MKKTIIFFFFITKLFSQESITVEYEFENFDNHKCTAVLLIKNDESIFKINDIRTSGNYTKKNEITDESSVSIVYNDEISTLIYSDSENANVRFPLYDGEIVYKTPNKAKYELTGNIKNIEGMSCQEAKILLNGRKYLVWFSTNIETGLGPMKLNGLPGLILEVTESTNKFKMTLKSLKKGIDEKFFTTQKEFFNAKKLLSFEQYNKKITELLTIKKVNMLTYFKERNLKFTPTNNEERLYTNYIIDIPSNLIKDLNALN